MQRMETDPMNTTAMTRRAALRTVVLGSAAGATAMGLGTLPAAAQTRKGSVKGRGGHTASGTVTLKKSGSGWTVSFSSGFKVDRAPDPVVAFGSGSTYSKSTVFSAMKASGAQSFKVPANIDPSNYSAVWVWCRRFNQPLAVASL